MTPTGGGNRCLARVEVPRAERRRKLRGVEETRGSSAVVQNNCLTLGLCVTGGDVGLRQYVSFDRKRCARMYPIELLVAKSVGSTMWCESGPFR